MNNNNKFVSNKFLSVFLLLIFFYLLILQLWAIWPFTIDDMYIPLRYAYNWAMGNGLLWNTNSYPVEGYSNFSFVALAALVIKLGGNPIIVFKWIGVLGLVTTSIAIYNLSRFWFSKWLAVIPCIWLLFYKGQILWTASGLETTSYQALIAISLLLLLRAMGYCYYPYPCDNPYKTHYAGFALVGLILAVASLTRPEGPCFMLLFFGIAWINSVANRQKIGYGLSLGGLIFCLIYIPYFIWRLVYYGRLFPNPIYCKGFTDSFLSQIDKNYLHFAWPFLLIAIPAIKKSKDKCHYFFWLPSFMYLILLAKASPLVAFANRLFLPSFMLLLPLTLLGLVCLIGYVAKKNHNLFYVLVVIASMLLVVFFIPTMSLLQYREFTVNPIAGEHLRQLVVQWLKKHIIPGRQVILADSGMIPYLSPSLIFIDSYCLNNRKMTEQQDPAMYQHFCAEVLADKPEVIILTSLIEHGRVTYAPADVCLHDKLQYNQSYIRQVSYQTDNKQSIYCYEIYTLKRFGAKPHHLFTASMPLN